jgi:hypothetical protein
VTFFWIPAFAGMTFLPLYQRSISLVMPAQAGIQGFVCIFVR